MELNLSEIYGSAHRIYNLNPSNKPIQIKQESESQSLNTNVEVSKTNAAQNTLQNKISNDQDIKAIVNDENLLSNEDALKKKLLQNVLEEIKGSAVSVHPNNVSLKSANFDYSEKESMGNSYTMYGSSFDYDYAKEEAKTTGYIYAHYAHVEKETSFAMNMEFTVKTPTEEFNVNINISYTQSFKKELYEENLHVSNEIDKNKNEYFHHEKTLSSKVENIEDPTRKSDSAQFKNEEYHERVGYSKGNYFEDKNIDIKLNTYQDESHHLTSENQWHDDSSGHIAPNGVDSLTLNKSSYEYMALGSDEYTQYKPNNAYSKTSNPVIDFFNQGQFTNLGDRVNTIIDKPIITFDKDIEDKSQFENIHLVFDAQEYEPLNLVNNNGILEFTDSQITKPKKKPLYLRIWEEHQKQEIKEEIRKERLHQETIKEEKTQKQHELIALTQEDIGFIYLSSFSKQSEEFTSSSDVQKVNFVKDNQGLPSILTKTDITV